MYKTIWSIVDEVDNCETTLTYYHFGKEPKFPTWYMEEGHLYSIEMYWNFKLMITLNIFLKCLFKSYVIQ